MVEHLRTIVFDNATKLFSFSSPNSSVGVITYGQAAIGNRTAHSFVPEFESQLTDERLSLHDFASKLSNFIMTQWEKAMPNPYSGQDMTFVVGGFDKEAANGVVYLFDIHRNPVPKLRSNVDEFGITWGGQREFVDRLLNGYDVGILKVLQNEYNFDEEKLTKFQKDLVKFKFQVPVQFLPLQDCVDLAVFFIQTTIYAQNPSVGIRGCGGSIDVATITRSEGFKYIKRKEIQCN
jgi:hypothetical protein